MPRKRMIDPTIWTDEGFGELSERGRLMYIGLFSMADDEGRGESSSKLLKARLFPYDHNIRITDITTTLLEIGSKMSIIFYECGGKNYYAFKNWTKWQKVEKPTKSRLPPPTNIATQPQYPFLIAQNATVLDVPFLDDSGNTPRQLPEYSPTVRVPSQYIDDNNSNYNKRAREDYLDLIEDIVENYKALLKCAGFSTFNYTHDELFNLIDVVGNTFKFIDLVDVDKKELRDVFYKVCDSHYQTDIKDGKRVVKVEIKSNLKNYILAVLKNKLLIKT